MRIRDVVVWHSAIWLVAGSSVCAVSEENPAAQPISGKHGVVLSRAVVNFSEMARQEALHPTPRTQKPERPEREAPRKQGLPAGAIIKLAPESTAATPSPKAVGSSPLSLVLANSFPAEGDNHTVIPPDTQGTAGPNHLVVTLNSNVVVQDRAGNRLKVVSLDNFWAPLGISRTTDPRVVYDPFNDRWIIATSGDFQLPNPSVLVGVSQTGDPAGNWNLYKAAVDGTGHHFCDFPVLGFNKTWVAIMCNVFDNNSSVQFFAGYIYVFDKFNLYNQGDGSHVMLEAIGTNGDDSNVTPASTYDNNVATEYLVEEYNGNQGGVGLMRLWAINGPVGSPTLSSLAFPGTTIPWDEQGTRNFAPQLGSSTGIDTGDARIGNVIYRNGTLWTTHPVYYPCCASSGHPPNRSSIQWWQIDTSGNVLQHGLIDNADASFFRSYPTIAVNQFNDALIGYSRFSPNEFAGGFYSFHAHSDPAGVLEAETTLKAGEATYVKTGSGNSNRWGDYSNTAVDPIDDNSFWTIQEYAASPSSTWGTWWGQTTLFGAPAVIQITPSNTTVTAGVPLADFRVAVFDAQGYRVLNYTGTVHFSSTDPSFSMADYTFSASDDGAHDFRNVVTLFKAGPESIFVSDFANSFQATSNFTVVPGPVNGFSIEAPNSAIHDVAFNLTVTAQDAFQNTVGTYGGTVRFASSDSSAGLPQNYQFNPSTDNGVHTFSPGATLRQPGSQNISVTDVAMGSIQGSASVYVIGPATHLSLTAPASVTRTKPFTLTVTALDALNKVDPIYGGTIHFTTTDSASPTLPADYPFTAGDQGRHYFVNGVTLNTIGSQTVTATDTVTSTIIGSASTNVAHLSAIPRTLYVRLGQQFNNLLVANFSEDVSPDPSTLTVNIDWGDGSGPTTGNVSGGGGVYSVSGMHRYIKLPEQPAVITIQDVPNGLGPITVNDTVRIWPKTESH